MRAFVRNQYLLLLLLMLGLCCTLARARKLTIGLIYCDEEHLDNSRSITTKVIGEAAQLSARTKFTSIEIRSLQIENYENPLSLAHKICETLLSKFSIYAIVVCDLKCLRKNNTDEGDYLTTLSTISLTSSYYGIPIFDLNERHAMLSDKVTYFVWVCG